MGEAVLDKVENKGIEKGKIEILASLVEDGILTLQQAAERMNMSVRKFKATAKKQEIYL
ncbi:MAG: hypothetical protein II567_05420 [Candidatus Riflebacteria bacterium]|jgi:hypothetical protein|nr:hypothetical protein [Candidatus Riflebacteria bacterium]MBR4328584.1 hypothetical protein [Candidatus Riflebacteria bacterium]MBR4571172.1 hypothetical protein [Candidatus Riflebacteria bacterium]